MHNIIHIISRRQFLCIIAKGNVLQGEKIIEGNIDACRLANCVEKALGVRFVIFFADFLFIYIYRL